MNYFFTLVFLSGFTKSVSIQVNLNNHPKPIFGIIDFPKMTAKFSFLQYIKLMAITLFPYNVYLDHGDGQFEAAGSLMAQLDIEFE